jgi:hypothetical protein
VISSISSSRYGILKYAREVLLFAVLQGIIGGLFLYHYPVGTNLYYQSSSSKHQRLKDAPSPRIIFVGGSSFGFGLDSPMVRDQLGFEPINMGLHGMLGATFMINEVRDFIRPGDVVVLGLEVTLLTHQDSGFEMRFMLEHRRDAIRYLNWDQTRFLLDNALIYFGGITRGTVRHLQGKPVDSSWVPRLDKDMKIFNEYGDVVLHRSLKQAVIPKSVHRFRVDPGYQKKIGKLLRGFHSHCRDQDARIFFTHSPVMSTHFEKTSDVYHQVDDWLRENTEIPILNSPDELVYPPESFFDTPYHLWGDAIFDRTQKLIDRLQPLLKATNDT